MRPKAASFFIAFQKCLKHLFALKATTFIGLALTHNVKRLNRCLCDNNTRANLNNAYLACLSRLFFVEQTQLIRSVSVSRREEEAFFVLSRSRLLDLFYEGEAKIKYPSDRLGLSWVGVVEHLETLIGLGSKSMMQIPKLIFIAFVQMKISSNSEAAAKGTRDGRYNG